jgi:hypothetical protein
MLYKLYKLFITAINEELIMYLEPDRKWEEIVLACSRNLSHHSLKWVKKPIKNVMVAGPQCEGTCSRVSGRLEQPS